MNEDAIVKVLRSFKDLTRMQAEALLAIMVPGRPLKRSEMVSILHERNLGEGTIAYKIIGSLEEKDVLFEHDGLFTPIDPQQLVDDCQSASLWLGEKVDSIKINYDWKTKDPLNRSMILKKQPEIVTKVCSLARSNFKIQLIVKNEEMQFWNLIPADLDVKLSKGDHDCIIFEGDKTKANNSGVIVLSPRKYRVGGEENVFYGHMIFDESLVNVFRRGIKNAK